MDNEQPNTNNYSTSTGKPFTYFSTVSYAGANFTKPVRGLSPTAAEATGMGGADNEGMGDDSATLYNQVETLRSCLACLEYVDAEEFSTMAREKEKLTLKCLDVIGEVIKGFYKEWMAEEEE